MEMGSKEAYTIDVGFIFKTILKRIWIVILVGVLVAALGFVGSKFLIEPTYSSTVKFYVNNISSSSSTGVVSSSQILAAQQLVNTYSQILDSTPTYDEIINDTGYSYTPAQLSNMIESGSSNETEIMYVTVTANDPNEAASIAESITKVLPERISEVIAGAKVVVIEPAKANNSKVFPNVLKYTALGLVIGAFGAAFVLALLAMLDNKIHDEEYITQTYNCPILSKIPSLTEKNHGKNVNDRKSKTAVSN